MDKTILAVTRVVLEPGSEQEFNDYLERGGTPSGAWDLAFQEWQQLLMEKSPRAAALVTIMDALDALL